MEGTISLPVWHLVIYLLGGVSLGAVIAMLVLVFSGPAPRTKPKPNATTQPNLRPASNPSPTATLNQAVVQKRTLTVDKAAGILRVTPRRVRRWLDEGVLVAVPMTDGARRVTALSVHDLLARLAAGKAEVSEDEPAQDREGQERPQERSTEPESEKDEGESGYPAPIPGQFYWYHVKGRKQPYHTMKEALAAAGVPLSEKMYPAWATVPDDIRALIRREKVG